MKNGKEKREKRKGKRKTQKEKEDIKNLLLSSSKSSYFTTVSSKSRRITSSDKMTFVASSKRNKRGWRESGEIIETLKTVESRENLTFAKLK